MIKNVKSSENSIPNRRKNLFCLHYRKIAATSSVFFFFLSFLACLNHQSFFHWICGAMSLTHKFTMCDDFKLLITKPGCCCKKREIIRESRLLPNPRKSIVQHTRVQIRIAIFLASFHHTRCLISFVCDLILITICLVFLWIYMATLFTRIFTYP